MARTKDEQLQLTCPGCGAVMGLTGTKRIVSRVRPFVEEHRACGAGAGAADLEMRSAYSRSA